MHRSYCVDKLTAGSSQHANNLKTTSYQRRCDVMTSCRHRYDVVLTPCACWVDNSNLESIGNVHLDFNCTWWGNSILGKTIVILEANSVRFLILSSIPRRTDLYITSIITLKRSCSQLRLTHTMQGDIDPLQDKNPAVIPRKCTRRKPFKSELISIYFLLYWRMFWKWSTSMENCSALY